jgi:hypothetical protein
MGEVQHCRICFIENEDEILIQPCHCTTAYVHETCLQQWRAHNTTNDNYLRCEICHAEYVIYQRYPTETFYFKLIEKNKTYGWISLYFIMVFTGQIFITFLDFFLNNISINILTFDAQNTFLNNRGDYDIAWFIYYLNYASYIECMFFFVYFFFKIVTEIKRKKEYLKKTIALFIIHFVLGWSYFYNYYIFYKGFNNIGMYLAASICAVIGNGYIIKTQMVNHNKIIKNMNIDNVESIISFNFNPMIEIVE